jgi:hypothetical protein
MRKLQIEDAEVMQIALQQEIARSEESRYDHRLHGLLLVTQGNRAGRSQNGLAKVVRRCSVGCVALSRAVSRPCVRANAQGALLRLMPASGASSKAICARPHGASDTRHAVGGAGAV